MRVGRDVVFLLALLENQQERPLAGVEALILERLLNELRLAGLQKAGKDVHGDIRHSHRENSLLLSTPKSFETASSFSFEPITQMRPVTIAPPSRISGSPGT